MYNVAKNKDIVEPGKNLDDLIAQSYKLPDSYYKITIDKYNADGSYYPVAVSYYVRTDVDKATGKKNFVWDKASLKWEIEMDKAKTLSPRKDKLVLNAGPRSSRSTATTSSTNTRSHAPIPTRRTSCSRPCSGRTRSSREQPAVRIPTGGFPVVSVTCSSLLTEKRDRNMYQPVKIFDGKPDTGWAENAPGSGLGEWIEIAFAKPVTADKLLVSPGWFDQRYWNLNNRIRVLAVELDDVRLEGNFKDQMVAQEVDLRGAKTFTQARFIIRDVYRTAKDDDSCIAEIEFRLGGRKVDLDLSAVADQLKVVPKCAAADGGRSVNLPPGGSVGRFFLPALLPAGGRRRDPQAGADFFDRLDRAIFSVHQIAHFLTVTPNRAAASSFESPSPWSRAARSTVTGHTSQYASYRSRKARSAHWLAT